MKALPVLIALVSCSLIAGAQQRRSLLDSDPNVVYLDEEFDNPIELLVVKEAPIFADKDGKRQLGTIVTDQKVTLEAMTDRAYRVKAKTGGNQVKGWVAPWAFASKDPKFVENLKKLYTRMKEVKKLIENHEVAIGMTMDEVGQSLGSPNKTKVRQTEKGRSGSWEFIDYDEVQHYNFIRDPLTGQVFRQVSHVTKEEKGNTTVEFEDDVVVAIEQSEDRGGAGRVTILPPIIFGW